MPVICSACKGQRPYGDFVQISYQADPGGYYRKIYQRANGVRISEWRSFEPDMESYINKQSGVYCFHDGHSIQDDLLTPEETELLVDRRLPMEHQFNSEKLVQNLLEIGTRIRSDVHVYHIDANQGTYDEQIPIPNWLERKLQSLGINKLYEHQGEAIQNIREGRNVVLCTKTASGKSLAYNVPIIERLVVDSNACALYLAPFKALVEDQFTHLKKWADDTEEQGQSITMNGFSRFFVKGQQLSVGVLHGQRNIPEHLRKDQASSFVFSEGRYWLTNVHYLHYILQGVSTPNGKGPQLVRFLRNLRFVVIDELHQYSGMLGSKVAMVLRRLRMLCDRLGNKNVQFIACSATIANPRYLAEELTGMRGMKGFHEISGVEAPVKKKTILMWNPGLADGEQKKRAIVSDLYEILRIIYNDGRWPRSIIFSSNRQQAQLLSREINMILRSHLYDHNELTPNEPYEFFLPYHAYLTQEVKERTIQKLEQGEILGVVTTTALEVGIDVKCLDVCILLGYPGSQASFWQQAGRVGRSRDGVVIMMVQEEPLQQHFARNPDQFFTLAPESAAINTTNPRLLKEYLEYAAHELGGTLSNAMNYFRISALRKIVEEASDKWQLIEGKLLYRGESPKYQSLFTMGATYTVVTKSGWNEDILFQGVDERSLIRDYHVDAIFLGPDNRTFYKVKWVNNRQRKVVVEPIKADYYTRGIVRDSIEIHDTTNLVFSDGAVKTYLGNIIVKRSTFGYKKIHNHGVTPPETVQLTNTYPVSFQTESLWLMWDQQGKDELRELLKEMENCELTEIETLIEGSLHAVEHAIASAIPAVVRCSIADFRHTSFYSATALFGMPGMFFYDSQTGGGSGIVEVIAEKIEILLEKALQIVSSCRCSDGCPSCIQLFHCEKQNEPLHKAGALLVINYLINHFNNGNYLSKTENY